MTTARLLLLLALVPLGCPGAGATSDTADGTGTATTASPTTGETGGVCPLGPPIAEAEFPSTFAAAICAARTTCGCAPADCVATVTDALSSMATEAQSRAFTYDPDCAAYFLATLAAAACDDHSLVSTGCETTNCRVYSGPGVEGDACEYPDDIYTDACAGTLECSFRGPPYECVEFNQPTVQEGQQCFSESENWFIAECPDGTFCDSGATNNCVAAPTEGQPCVNDRCDTGLYCSDGDQCTPRKDVGAACGSNTECMTRECENGMCIATPWICDPVWSDGA